MDSNPISKSIAAALNIEQKTVDSMLAAFAKVLSESADTMTTVAIPSFGSFVPVKYDEEIKPDLATGKKMIFPPQIVLQFKPSANLRKNLLENHE